MAFQNAIYQTLSNFGKAFVSAADAAAARAQLGLTSTGSAVATATDPAAARTALELGSMATQDANNVAITGGTGSLSSLNITGTTPSTSTTSGAAVVAGGLAVGGGVNAGGTVTGAAFAGTQSLSGIILARNQYDSSARGIISGPYADRLQGATARYTVTRSPNVAGNLTALFDKSTNSHCQVPVGETGWVEIDLLSNGNAARGYWGGTYVLTLRSTVSRRPESFLLEIQESNDTWTTISSVSSVSQNVYVIEDTNETASRNCKKIRLTWTSKQAPNFPGGVMFIEFFPARPDGNEPTLFLSSSSPTDQIVYGAFNLKSSDGSAESTVSPAVFIVERYQFTDGSYLQPNANGDLIFTSKNGNPTTLALA